MLQQPVEQEEYFVIVFDQRLVSFRIDGSQILTINKEVTFIAKSKQEALTVAIFFSAG